MEGDGQKGLGRMTLLADTSVWIAYFRPQGHEDLKASLEARISGGDVHTCWPVRAEVLVGARDEAAYSRLSSLFEALPEVPVDNRIWEQSAELGFRVRRAGLSIPMPDLLIAQAASAAGLELWHMDSHFELLVHHLPLVTRSFLSVPARGCKEEETGA